MNSMTIKLTAIAKEFNRRLIFSDISFSLGGSESIAITGRNGSGKSTLVKIICGLLAPTRGTIEFAWNGKAVVVEELRNHIGLVSPYLQLYDEFSGVENLEILSKIRADGALENGRIEDVLTMAGLWDRRKDYVRTYSSGMKQRLKYAFAILHRPALLILDEPTSNLDKEGVEMVRAIVEEQVKAGVLVVATNDAEEAAWCMKEIKLDR